jgi:hypothetical protein
MSQKSIVRGVVMHGSPESPMSEGVLPVNPITSTDRKEIPTGYCHCGCGGKTKLTYSTNKNLGYKKGTPRMFLSGHNTGIGEMNHHWNGGRRKNAAGYILVRSGNAEISEHISIAEKVFKKPLPSGAVIHHGNEDKADNRNGNLVICQDESYHRFLHVRTRALKSSGHASWRKCRICKEYDKPENMYIDEHQSYHARCLNVYQNRRYHMKKNNAINNLRGKAGAAL